MPKIPVYLASTDYRAPRGDVEAAGASGRMLAKFGEVAGETAGAFVKLGERVQAARAEQQVTAANAASAGALEDLGRGFDEDADHATVGERFDGQVAELRDGLAGTIADGAARRQFLDGFDRYAQVKSLLVRGAAIKRENTAAVEGLQANLGLYAGVAAGARHPVEHDDAVALALREIQGKAEAGFISAEDAGRMEQSFYGDLAGRQARRAIAADPQAALDSLKGSEDFAALDADARARLTGEAERAVQAQAVRVQTEQAAVRRDTQIRLPGYLDALRDGAPPDDARFGREALTSTLGAAEGDKRWAEIEQAQRFGQVMAQVKWATPSEISDLVDYGERGFVLQKLPFVLGSLDGKENLIELAVDRRNAQLWSKPADYVLDNPHVAELHAAMAQATAPPQPSDATAALQGLLPAATGQPAEPPPLLSPENRRATIAAYANGTLAEQERLGVPEDRRLVLPEKMAQETVARIAASAPDEAAASLAILAEDWGNDWPRVLTDLQRSGLPPAYDALAAMENPVARDTFAQVLAAQKEEPGAPRSRAGADADTIDGLLPESLVPFHEAANVILTSADATEAGPAEGIALLDQDMRGAPQDSLNPGSHFVKIAATSDQENLFQDKVFSDQPVLTRGEVQMAQADTQSDTLGNRRIAPFAPPRKPISAQELTRIRSTVPNAPPGADMDANIAEALRHKGNDFWFYNQVTNKGPWDYKKQQGRAFADFGNFNYGATGAAIGYSEAILLRMAGWKQVDDGNIDPAWGVAPSKLEAAIGVGGTAPFGDDPKDQFQISQGFKFFHALYPKGK